ncbi:biopolymer transporter Tol [Bacteroidota bacterium]
MKTFLVTVILAVIFFSNSYSQFNEYEPGYEWFTIKGEHVIVHYHPEAERTARIVAKIADEVWDPICSLYEYEPDLVHFVVKDIDDFSNGATFFFDNKIEIWASALDFDLRGTENWLRNVITHEFTHMVQTQAAMKLGRSVPALYFQFMNYEDKRRPDILYGFPNFIVSYPVGMLNMPIWFAEGTAQYQRKEFKYDVWDTHQDMIIRSYALDDRMLTWNQMGVFNKTSLGSESVYNSGYALTLYIAQKYGEDKIRKLTKELATFTNINMDEAIEEVLGISGDQLYEEWTSTLKKSYKDRMKDVLENRVEGEIIREEGFGNFYPVFSKDGSKIIYVSNKNYDFFSLSNIYEYDFSTGQEKTLVSQVRSTISYLPDENKIVYAKLSEDNPRWKNIHDLYIYDITTDEEKRITFGLRANAPNVSHNGQSIVFLFQKDGTTNLGRIDIDGENFKRLTFFENGEQVFNPKFSVDDSYIVFSVSENYGRNIAKVNYDATGFEFIIKTDSDERNPVVGYDGKLYYSSDESNIFNIYSYDFTTGEKKKLTNVTGGAFMPSVNINGDIAYAGYNSYGYKIYRINKDQQAEVDPSKEYVWIDNPPLATEIPNGDIGNFNIRSLEHYDDTKIPDYESNKYSGFFSRISFFPYLRFDNYNISDSWLDKFKPGLYVASSDYLNRYSLFAGGSVNRNLERDLFLIFEYRNKVPLLYNLGLNPQLSFELYSISRNTQADLQFGVDSTYSPPLIDYNIPIEVTYNLFEVDIVGKHKIFAEGNNLEFRFVFSEYTATLGSFIIPESGNTLYPKSDDTYFIGRSLQMKYTHDYILPTLDTDINPVGRNVELHYTYEFNKYNPNSEYEVEGGILQPVYQNFNFHKLELNWEEYMQVVRDHTFNIHFRAGSILGPEVPDFFDFYLGGLIGMKSYPFYAVNGNEIGWINLSYRFPLFKNLDASFGHLYFDKIFFSVYGDFGNAWTGEFPGFDNFKKGAGFELRVKMNSFYFYPTSLFFNAAYSFDEINRTVRGENVRYGKEWQFYGGILFDFAF